MSKAKSAEKVVQDIRRKTRRRFSAEEKIRIVLEGLRGEESIATLCRREGLNPNLYYRWSKEFLEAGKKRLVGDTTREATSSEVTDLRHENGRLKQVVAEMVLENRLLKKKRDGLRLGGRYVRRTAAEKYEVIRLVEGSDLPVRQTLRELQVNRSTFYVWYHRYAERGRAGLQSKPSAARRYWNRIPPRVRQRVVKAALADPERSPRELAWQLTDREGHFLSESSVYRILKGTDAPICQDTRSGGLDDLLAGAEIGHDALVDLASEETFQAPDDLSLGSAVRRAACDVINGRLMVPHANDDGSIEGGVGVSVAASIEAVPAGGHPGRGRDRTRAAELREGGFRTNPVGIIAEDDQQFGRGVGAHTEALTEGRRCLGREAREVAGRVSQSPR